ncbi:hypothetical protein NDU88_001892 [Pleurodeles waltl]|uniref:Uncharacterized protein n=1 Tax=Pleurodeles waltl TaxID=8319 RepID=A0AAV7NFK4_PLEWA|nr:hypothetical protein NDU88_001892 [Pleurodeles waltl]
MRTYGATELPATSQEESGTESRFPFPCDEDASVRNPSGRIPEPLHSCQDDTDAIGVTGNPAIRVPQDMKRNEGLRAARSPKKEDAGGDERRDGGRNPERTERKPMEETKTLSVKNTTTGKEATEGREFRHAPGGTWLNQAHQPLRCLNSPVFCRDSARVGPGGIRAVLAPQAPRRKVSVGARNPQGPQPLPGAPGPLTQQRGPGAAAAEHGPLTLFPTRPASPLEAAFPSKRRGRRPPLASGGRSDLRPAPGPRPRPSHAARLSAAL